jgi:hypothetical protein
MTATPSFDKWKNLPNLKRKKIHSQFYEQNPHPIRKALKILNLEKLAE